MDFETYRMRNPMRVACRDNGVVRETFVDDIRFRRRNDDDVEPNLALVTNCARGLVKLDGSPATVADLMQLHVEEGMRGAMQAAMNAVNFTGGMNS